ncbi:MAG: 50S ribosomal protein L29 [Fidelibacterota bacterium]|nr:MAG: 50S ribosomal protein L29 [Candidatus Neomarinimicrobiota bacterium]
MIREEILAMSMDDLRKHLQEKEDELTNLRFQKALQQLESPHTIRTTRREIAQIKTLLKEYELGRREERNE